MEMDHKATGESMARRRARNGISLRSMAALLQTSPAHLSRLEGGLRAWTPEMKRRYLGMLKQINQP